jgi:hypothetical protein
MNSLSVGLLLSSSPDVTSETKDIEQRAFAPGNGPFWIPKTKTCGSSSGRSTAGSDC